MVVDAAALGEAGLAAEVAVVLTERGLGGNDVDLAHRVDALHRERSQRARDALMVAKRWAGLAEGTLSPLMEERGASSRELKKPELSVGSLLALAYPDRIAKNRGAGGAFLLANGRGANVEFDIGAGARAVHCRCRGHRYGRPGPHRAGGRARRQRNRSAVLRSHRKP